MKRRTFFKLLGATGAALALPYEPQKLYFFGGWPGAVNAGELKQWVDNEVLSRSAAAEMLGLEQQQYYSAMVIKRMSPQLNLVQLARGNGMLLPAAEGREIYIEGLGRTLEAGEQVTLVPNEGKWVVT